MTPFVPPSREDTFHRPNAEKTRRTGLCVPRQRFVPDLTARHAWLGASVDRYSFAATDLHRRLQGHQEEQAEQHGIRQEACRVASGKAERRNSLKSTSGAAAWRSENPNRTRSTIARSSPPRKTG